MKAFIFDEVDQNRKDFHGASMLKAVDVLVESQVYDIFVELKKYPDILILQEISFVTAHK